MTGASDLLSELRDLVERKSYASIYEEIDPDLAAASDAADSARGRLIDPLRAFTAAVEDLRYRFQRCSG